MPPFNSSTWKRLAQAASARVTLAAPAEEQNLVQVEQSLQHSLPYELRELLLESDGIRDEYGAWAIWPVERLKRANLEFRNSRDFQALYMPFGNLLFFGEDGGGDQFAFPIHADGAIHRADVFRWDHETDSRVWFSARLEQYLEMRLKG